MYLKISTQAPLQEERGEGEEGEKGEKMKGRKGEKKDNAHQLINPLICQLVNLSTYQLVNRITILDFVLLRLRIALFGLVGWDRGSRGLRSTCVGCWQDRVQ